MGSREYSFLKIVEWALRDSMSTQCSEAGNVLWVLGVILVAFFSLFYPRILPQMILTKTFFSVLVMTLLSGLVIIGPTGCRTAPAEEVAVEPQQPVLVSSTIVGQYTTAQLSARYTAMFGNLAPVLLGQYLKNSITVYKLVYKTKNTDGADIQASGALVVPTSTVAVPLLSVQHGTIRSDSDAPSYNGSGSDTYLYGSLFASSGSIVALPDYIGYGASKDLPHTYEHREGLATASLDMLRASREFLEQNKTNWDKRLYITGYSEGGYATMSLHKKLEEDAKGEFNLRASSVGAGAYDKTSFMKYVVNTATTSRNDYTSLYVWVLLTYDRIYGLNRPMSYYFKEPYATQIQNQRQNVSLNASLSQIFTETFKQSVNNGSEAAFVKAVADNDVYDWKPSVPVLLYHGTADQLVPYFNSQNAEAAMKKRGVNATLVPLEGANHTDVLAILRYATETYAFFQNTK
jgi:pimeloyl-ACP methyl ester carboxylesterase